MLKKLCRHEKNTYVYSVFYSDYMFRGRDKIVGVFDSLEKAKNAINNLNKQLKNNIDHYKIEKHILNSFS